MNESKILEPIAIRDINGNQIQEWSPEMIETIINTVAKDATHEELQMFAQVCHETGLNPFMKEIWFVKYGDNEPAIMTGRDGYLKMATQDPDFSRIQSFAVFENDKFELKTKQGEVVDVIHDFKHINRGLIVGAWAVAVKGDVRLYSYVPFEEHINYKKDQKTPTRFWKKNPSAMIRKVAEADVLKRIANISGVNAYETMGYEYSYEAINDNVQEAEYTKKTEEPQENKPEHKIEDSKSETDELAEKQFEEVKKALKQTNQKITLDNVDKKANFFVKNKNHIQFNEEMKERVMKIAEKELGTVDESDPVEPENVQEAEYTKKEAPTMEETEIDMVASNELESILNILETKKLAKNIKNIEGQCKLQIRDPETAFDENMMTRVVDLAKATITS